MSQNLSSNRASTDTQAAVAFDRLLDWVIGAVLGIAGILGILAGAAVYSAVDRPAVADLVHDPEFQSELLTRSEAIDALVALGQWSGVGLVAAGGVTALVGVAVVVAHGRARDHGRATPRWILGVVGAMVGAVLGFVPFSSALGGAVASYLDPDRTDSGIATGALAGVFSSLPLLVVAAFACVGLFVGLPGEVAAAVTGVFAVVALVSVAALVGVSALGGYVGQWVR